MGVNEDIELSTQPEQWAAQAEKLPSIGAVNLLSIKRKASLLLAQIGSGPCFYEYTRHDISHIDEMLKLVEWIVPPTAREHVTSIDWLQIVLSIYFHDLGMLVTESEFNQRSKSPFEEFKAQQLFADGRGEDYRKKISTLGEDAAEKFFYQEFVRHTHAKRIKAWISGTPHEEYGISTEVASVVNELLSPLNPRAREDLATICESHHLDDLDNLKKYAPQRAYGKLPNETCNLQYCAVILRSADILHMTHDRTPSIMYRTVNPADPISQREWNKQMGITKVASKLARDEDGNLDESAPRDIIEIHAYFTEPEPFFSLSSFLNYVESELSRCRDWVERTKTTHGTKVSFPWRKVDRDHIETKGFISRVFAFELDQPKILTLLTGHTLYNDTDVVLREIVQNAIDASRLQNHQEARAYSPGLQGSQQPPGDGACVSVEWQPEARTIVVADTGTGMTQEVIENHLLKVGSSRYSSEKFKESFPDFNAISRFGIGILTAFMVADEVDIFTCHPDDEEARHLILKNLHGKYLVKKLQKSDAVVRDISPHGTRIELRLRPSAATPEVERILRSWVLVPGCKIVMKRADGSGDVPIGFSSAASAISYFFASAGQSVIGDGVNPKAGDIRVFSCREGGFELAFATKWSEMYKEWQFVTLGHRNEEVAEMVERGELPCGVAIEGIRVEFDTPGYRATRIAALINACGAAAPKTNVARSAVEQTPELSALEVFVYRCLLQHVETEVRELQTRRSLSLSGAVAEGGYILSPLLQAARDGETHSDCVRELQLLLVEQGGERKRVAPKDLLSHLNIWTIECPLLRSADTLLREAESNASLTNVVAMVSKQSFPDDPILCAGGLDGQDWALSERCVNLVSIDRDSRRVDFRWRLGATTDCWKSIALKRDFLIEQLRRFRTIDGAMELIQTGHMKRVYVPFGVPEVLGAEASICVRTGQSIYFLPGHLTTDVACAAAQILADAASSETKVAAAISAFVFLRSALMSRRTGRLSDDVVSRVCRSMDPIFGQISDFDIVKFSHELKHIQEQVFDVFAWDRRSQHLANPEGDGQDVPPFWP